MFWSGDCGRVEKEEAFPARSLRSLLRPTRGLSAVPVRAAEGGRALLSSPCGVRDSDD